MIPYQVVDGKIVNNKFISRDENELALNKVNMSEHQEQVEFVSWCDAQPIRELSMLFAIPNGARVSMGTAIKIKKEGLRSGIPDLMLPVAKGKYHGLFIEFKRRRGGVISPEQKEAIAKLTAEGYCCVVAKGYNQAIRSTVAYLMQ